MSNRIVSVRVFSLLILSIYLSGCAEPLVSRLKGRGPVTVSPDNPYLASNLLLSQLSETRPELKGFLETKGYPEYLEVNKQLIGPLTLKLIYQSESFLVEIVDNTAVINNEAAKAPEPFQSPKQEQPSKITVNDPAELTPRGDLVHYVISPNETIEQIAGWYTDNPANAEKLLRLNSLQNLEVGDVVVIPNYMVKKKTRMP